MYNKIYKPMIIAGKEYNLRELFFEFFKMGFDSHESVRNEHSMQVILDYWVKERTEQS